MKSTFDSYPKMYADWSAIGWAMLLGHVPPPVRSLNAGAVQVVGEQAWEEEGGRLEPPKGPREKPGIKRAPGSRTAPKIAPGKKRRASAKARAKGARRK